jgi:rod shape-determining protein MreC
MLTGMAGMMLLVSLINPQLWQGPRTAALDASAPLIAAVSKPFQIASDTFSGMTGLAQIKAENVSLKSENKKLKEWYQTALLLQAENQSLKDLLNVLPEPEQSYITTRVIGDSGSSFVKSLLIQAGTDEGVEKGQAVLGDKGMIGRVIETGRNASRILLLTDINSRVPVIVAGSNQKAILAGTNDDMPILEHLPPDVLIEKGARVITSGHGGLFPQGLPVGQVSEVGKGFIKVTLYSDPANASYVQIIERPDDPNVRRSIDILTVPLSKRDGF